jgi:hypothetical protein
MVAGPTLTYFPVPGRGEIARLAFTVGKINVVVSFESSCLQISRNSAYLSKTLVHRSVQMTCQTHAAVVGLKLLLPGPE